MKPVLTWGVLALILLAPLAAAGFSPLLAWRDPIYIIAGFAGIIGLALMVLQPLLAGRLLPGVGMLRARQLHRGIGAVLVAAIVLHVGGLWLTSPPDVVDALTFTSPTAFSVWGVTAMWVIFATGLFAVMRFRGRISWKTWQRLHPPLGVIAVAATVLHTLLIDGTMELFTKLGICGFAVLITGVVTWRSLGVYRQR